MADLTVKLIKSIQIGDKIIGVKKGTSIKYNKYKTTEGIVLNKWETEKDAFEILLNNGNTLICSADHRWLTNRGWKYTIGKMNGNGRRPYLTTSNFISQLSGLLPLYTETVLFMKGYLAGIIEGDGILKIYKGKRSENDSTHLFRLTMKDNEGLERAYKYLRNFNIETNWFIFDKKRNIKGIRKNDIYTFNQIKELIKHREDPEFLRGYVSGFYDAEGSYSQHNTIRLGDIKIEHFNIVKKALILFGFKIREEIDQRKQRKHPMYIIRILGKKAEHIRFFQTFNTAIFHRKQLGNYTLSQSSKIISIKPLKEKYKMYDIETSCNTFIANGFVSHNCYARKISIRFNRATNESWTDMKLNEKAFNKNYGKRNGIIMFPTAHDIVPEHINECLVVLKKILKAGNSVLIVSKPHFQCILKMCRELEPYKEQIHFRFTITSINDEILKKFEPNAPIFIERYYCLWYMFSEGYKTSVSIEPFLDMDPIPLIKKVSKSVNQTIWIGKLNYMKTEFNTWNNVQKVVQNLQKLPEEIRLKLRLKDSIVKLYAKKGVKLPNLLVDFYPKGEAQIEPRVLGTAPPGDRTNFKEEK